MKSIFSLLTLFFLLQCINLFSQQSPYRPAPEANPFNLMQFVNASTGWVVGRNGLIRKTTDGGSHWSDQSSGVSSELFALSFVNVLQGWVCGRGGMILRTTDGGSTWQQQQSGTERLCHAMQFVDALHGWIVCDSGVVLATTNGGTSWTIQATQTISSLISVAFTSTKNGWACGSEGVLIKTTNGGLTWTTAIIDPALALWGIAFGDAMHGCIVASDRGYEYGRIFTTTDGGETWAAGEEGLPALFTVQLFKNNSGWVAGRSGTVLKTFDGGNSWTTVGTTSYWLSLSSFVDMNTGWVADPAGHLTRTIHGGIAWTPQSLLQNVVNLPALSSADAVNGSAAGTKSIPLRITHEGRAIFERSDKKLNDVYKKLLVAKKANPNFIRNLKATERIWIQYRDAQLNLRYPEHAAIEKKGPLPLKEALYLAHLTEDRTKALTEMLRTPVNGFAAIHPFHHTVNGVSYSGDNPMKIYVSDLKIVRSGNIHGGIGIDRPYWRDDVVICGKKYRKGIVMHPEDGGIIAYAEFLLPRTEGRLVGIAGWAEEAGAVHHGKMRYRIFVDGELLYGNELNGNGYREVDLDLGSGKVLRIETDDGLDGNEADHMAFGDLSILY